jgi:endonuclease I
MKIYVVLFSLFFFNLIHGQVMPYYQPATGLSDSMLKNALYNIIKGHTEYPYTSTAIDVWDILKQTDRDTANPNNVILIYSGRSVNAAQEYNSGNGWTREHVWAKSRGDFGTAPGAGTDVHHMRPLDNSVNTKRNNRNFDNCKTCSDVIDNGFNTGSKVDDSLWTFEPRDEVKGDVARMIFYMATRYEGENGEPDLELTNHLLSSTDKSPFQAVLTTLLTWHRADTVVTWERNRNDIIFNQFQHNRNPYIDYPELVEYIWGDSVGMIWRPVVSSVTVYSNQLFNILSNSVDTTLIIQSDSICGHCHFSIFDIDGNEIINGSIIMAGTVVDFSIYSPGTYYLIIKDDNKLLGIETITKK